MFNKFEKIKKALLKFTTTTTIIIIIIIILSLSVGLSLFFTRTLNRFVFEQTVVLQIEHIRAHVEAHLLKEAWFDRWQDPDSIQHFGEFSNDIRSSPNIARINLFNRDSVLIFSTVGKEIGQRVEEEDVWRALSGEVVYKVVSPEEAAALGLKHLLEIYIPIFKEGKVVGTAELYFDQSRLVALTRELRFWVWGLTLASILLITVFIYFAFRRQNRLIARQATELSAIIEKSPIGIYTINKDGVIDSFNPKMIELAGAKSATEMIGLNALELPAYKAVGLDKNFREGLGGKPFAIEVKDISFTGGKTARQHYFGVPIFEADGKTVEWLLLMVEDITLRKELEEKVTAYTGELEEKVKERTNDLSRKVEELERLNRAMVERELKMIELKKELEKARSEKRKRSDIIL